MRPRVAYIARVGPDIIDLVSRAVPQTLELVTPHGFDPDQLYESVFDVEFILSSGIPVDATLIERAASLRLLQCQGVGYDRVDLSAARRRGIPVCVTPAGSAVAVAEFTMMLLLGVRRRLIAAHNGLLRGEWLSWQLRGGVWHLPGRTLGIIGCGRVGQEVAIRARAFGMRLLYTQRNRLAASRELELDVRYVDLPSLLAESDVVTIHVPLSSETRGMIGAKEIARMKPGSILLNTARGPVVDDNALAEALRSGRLAGAGLDVHTPEPLPLDSPLRQLENVVLTPHIGAATEEALLLKATAAFENMERVLRGEEPLHRVA